jgi:KipI family sensor histidine kinase inhibitor
LIFAEPRFSPLGDGAVTITLGDEVSESMSTRVLGVAREIERTVAVALDVVPSYAAVTLFYDPALSTYEQMCASLSDLPSAWSVADDATPSSNQLVRIPVRYDGEDLDEVARRTGLTRAMVIELHSSREYRVYMLGFAPGFAYLGDLDSRLALPRRDSPRKRVPAGSVAIAEGQTAVYPSATAGGWHLIGGTDLEMFGIGRDPPALLAPGDRVVFERVPG